MLRPVHLALLLLMVAVVSCLEEPLEAARAEIEPPLSNANDLDTDASSYGYGRPWRYGGGGWRGGWGGWKGGWDGWDGWGGWGGWGGRGWTGRGGWW